MGDLLSVGLSQSLKDLGLDLGRLKTGTCPRLDGRTIDFSKMEPQHSDDPPQPFSFFTKKIVGRLMPCWLTYTSEKRMKLSVRALTGLLSIQERSRGRAYATALPLKTRSSGSRKERHRIFLEPEGLDTVEYYPNGFSTSLPLDIQIAMLRTIPGLEKVR